MEARAQLSPSGKSKSNAPGRDLRKVVACRQAWNMLKPKSPTGGPQKQGGTFLSEERATVKTMVGCRAPSA